MSHHLKVQRLLPSIVGAALCLLAQAPLASPQAGLFPDAHTPPVPGWTGPVFKLRQDYPATPPAAETQPWKSFDFKTQSLKYVQSVLAYCLEGNVQVDWQLEKNQVRNWYHVPWLHSTNSGREFVHGLTLERSSRRKELAPTQTGVFSNWAVGMYNAKGGFAIGQVWKDANSPDTAAAVFPDGTVSCKLLFTTAPPTQVPYLSNSFEWQAHITSSGSSVRSIQTVRLLQVDVAIRDARADTTTGWVFGTFVYDGNAPGQTPWERLVPVGLMWGNDPTITAAAVTGTMQLQETFINPNVGPAQHLGRAGRLNGPVDNPKSSCLSCHSTAQYEAVSPVLPPSGSTPNETMRWFRNVKAATPFDVGQKSLDYSLQLALGIQRFHLAHPSAPIRAVRGSVPRIRKKLHPVTR